MTTNWSLTAKFNGEFASGSQTYAGTGAGTLRYSWQRIASSKSKAARRWREARN